MRAPSFPYVYIPTACTLPASRSAEKSAKFIEESSAKAGMAGKPAVARPIIDIAPKRFKLKEFATQKRTDNNKQKSNISKYFERK